MHRCMLLSHRPSSARWCRRSISAVAPHHRSPSSASALARASSDAAPVPRLGGQCQRRGFANHRGGQGGFASLFDGKNGRKERAASPPPRRRTRGVDIMFDCRTLKSLARVASWRLEKMPPRELAAFWTLASRRLAEEGKRSGRRFEELPPWDRAAFWTHASRRLAEEGERKGPSVQGGDVGRQMQRILERTLEASGEMGYRYLAETAVGIARIVNLVDTEGRPRYGSLHDIFIGEHAERKQCIFDRLAESALPILSEFEPRELSNIIYSFGVVEYAPVLEGGRAVLDVFADEAMSNLEEFNPLFFHDMLWAYAKVMARNSDLFQAVGDVIVARDGLDDFSPQSLATIAWAYSTMEESHPKLFEKLADHVVSHDSLSTFDGQDLANIVWAYAALDISHPELFEKVADHIASLDSLRSFAPKAFSRIVWASATMGVAHRGLFERVARHITSLDNLNCFQPTGLSDIVWAFASMGETNPKLMQKVAKDIAKRTLDSFHIQHLSKIVWAFATAKEEHSNLFEKVASAGIQRQEEFGKPQYIANFLWAYAANGHIEEELFQSLSLGAEKFVREYNGKELAGIAWSYAVADADSPLLFNADFIDVCLEKEDVFTDDELKQLHQWNLWQEELKSSIRLPPPLAEKCKGAFASQEMTPSSLQDDVMFELAAMGLQPEADFITARGYHLAAAVEVDGSKVGIEVDEPTRFVDKMTTGDKLIKHRQVPNLERIPLISIPMKQWKELKDSGEKQEYLRLTLDTISFALNFDDDSDYYYR